MAVAWSGTGRAVVITAPPLSRYPLGAVDHDAVVLDPQQPNNLMLPEGLADENVRLFEGEPRTFALCCLARFASSLSEGVFALGGDHLHQPPRCFMSNHRHLIPTEVQHQIRGVLVGYKKRGDVELAFAT